MLFVYEYTVMHVPLYHFFSQACRDKGVDCIVAPYEADAQLAYLNKTGIAQVIITEDSDLVLFGCNKVKHLVVIY